MHKMKYFLLIFLISTVFLLFFAFSLSKYAEGIAQTVLENSINLQINAEINKYISENKVLFERITESLYDVNGSLCEIKINSYNMNIITNELQSLLTQKAQSCKSSPMYIPLFNLLNIKLLSGGPKIKTNIVPIGNVTVDTINELKSVGINHTAHKIALEFTLNFKATMPYDSINFKSCFTVVLHESLIIGDVPNVYLN